MPCKESVGQSCPEGRADKSVHVGSLRLLSVLSPTAVGLGRNRGKSLQNSVVHSTLWKSVVSGGQIGLTAKPVKVILFSSPLGFIRLDQVFSSFA